MAFWRGPVTPSGIGLRTRYFPRGRIARGLFGVGPWVDVVLLLLFFVLVDSRLTLQPGVVVELPRAPFREGTQNGLIAVVLSIPEPEGTARQEIVFFDDQRYRVAREEEMRSLTAALADSSAGRSGHGLMIHADRHVAHGTILRLVTMARQAGLQSVNLSSKP